MSIDNDLLRSASAIDPLVKQHSLSLLKELPQFVQNLLSSQEKESYDLEVHKFNSDTALNFSGEESIVKWWIERKERYPFLSRMALALLTCFYGPNVETSVSIMNNIITSGTSRLNITTLNVLQTVKYHLLAEGKSSVDYF
ncbi:hypothetical protein AVEN_81404-1 [Araneus ventricosus]|uniref:HAT C-terminal dimerisation domain-containing protein n=1 Tax=Araneus ventricosus TaxID=182803 RepID=A0A4Y2UPE5_ARAVE|nr:hypothetical protein AVEN_162053-1 [Araneus ventricosus]GBO14901.1 hypothetical protein AVEN_81404-1 [Araneus ventricosus]